MTISDEGVECCRRRGRPRMNRSIQGGPSARCYAPQCSPNEEDEVVILLPEEIAVLNLIDLQDLEQEQAAAVLGVSRKTIWRDIHETHRKIADALIHGKTIQMAGCTRRLEGHCPQRNQDMCPKKGGGLCPKTSVLVCGNNNEPSETPDS
jgi:predicted DNA-binding protein (UPF0251 family)